VRPVPRRERELPAGGARDGRQERGLLRKEALRVTARDALHLPARIPTLSLAPPAHHLGEQRRARGPLLRRYEVANRQVEVRSR